MMPAVVEELHAPVQCVLNRVIFIYLFLGRELHDNIYECNDERNAPIQA